MSSDRSDFEHPAEGIKTYDSAADWTQRIGDLIAEGQRVVMLLDDSTAPVAGAAASARLSELGFSPLAQVRAWLRCDIDALALPLRSGELRECARRAAASGVDVLAVTR